MFHKQNDLEVGMKVRVDHALRKRVAEMTEEEQFQFIFIDDLTGLPNGRAYKESPRKAFVAIADLDSLKWINDQLGYAAGDAMLQSAARVIQMMGLEVYRMNGTGDELVFQFDSPLEAYGLMPLLQKQLEQTAFSWERDAGEYLICQGIGMSFGISNDSSIAELALKQQKERRLQDGTRAGRGDRPPLLREVRVS
jgi:GGDEF domain-containing protein